MHAHEALSHIEAIRRQLARTERFHGYRALPVAGGAVIAGLTAAAQPWLAPNPGSDLPAYLALWVIAAAVAGGWSLAAVLTRPRQHGLHDTLAQIACEQFTPCVVAGALVTLVIAVRTPELGWMLPGLWAVLFSLGLFASYRLLPPGILAPAGWFLAAGCTALAGGPEFSLAPWTMGVTFGVGQLGIAAVLYRQEVEAADG